MKAAAEVEFLEPVMSYLAKPSTKMAQLTTTEAD